MAYDATHQRVYATITNSNGSELYSINVNTWAATRLSILRRPDNSGLFFIDGLAFDQKRRILYGVRSISNGSAVEGLYRIEPGTGATTLLLQFEAVGTNNAILIGGVDWCPTTDLLYLTDDDPDLGRWIYSWSHTTPSVLNQEVQYPEGATDFDGVAASPERLYLLSDSADTPSSALLEGNNGLHYVYNLLGASFEDPIPGIYPERTLSTSVGLVDPTGGAAWIARYCNGADVASSGQQPIPDGLLTADDIIIFVARFFEGDLRADLAGSGQSFPPDGDLTADDLIVYINRFLQGC
jgi:hypothetical protein